MKTNEEKKNEELRMDSKRNWNKMQEMEKENCEKAEEVKALHRY